MSMVINHNMMAMNANRNLSNHYGNLADSTRKLSSGLRVENAADDAAGLAIRELMRADIAALNQGVRNANDGISLIQTADGALGVIDEKLIRMKELAEQAATGTYDSIQRAIIDSEYQQMASEITRIANSTDFNGIKLLDGSLSATTAVSNSNGPLLGQGHEGWLTSSKEVINNGTDPTTGTDNNSVHDPIEAGDPAYIPDQTTSANTPGGEQIQSDGTKKPISDTYKNENFTKPVGTGEFLADGTEVYDLNSKGPLKVHFGSGNDRKEDYYFITIASSTASSLGVGNQAIDENGKPRAGHNISTQANAQAALEAIDKAIVSKDNIRAHLGAMQNRLENTISNLSIQAENLQAAESRISDVDVATEMTNFVRNQTLANAANSMLSQANQIPQMALRLIG